MGFSFFVAHVLSYYNPLEFPYSNWSIKDFLTLMPILR